MKDKWSFFFSLCTVMLKESTYPVSFYPSYPHFEGSQVRSNTDILTIYK